MQPRRYSPWRFSLRTALIATTLVCIWLAWHWQATRRQQRAVATIRASGGWVAYDYAWQDGEWVKGGRSWAPAWLTKIFGEDAFHRVEAVHLAALFHTHYENNQPYYGPDTEATVPAELWQAVENLPSTEWLSLNARTINDEDLQHLRALQHLRVLNMEAVPIEGSGLKYLVSLRNLQHLNLSRIHLRDEHAHWLLQMKHLQLLGLNESTISPGVAADLQQKMPLCKQYYEHWPPEPEPASPWTGIQLDLTSAAENNTGE